MDRRRYEMIGRLIGFSMLSLVPIFVGLMQLNISLETEFDLFELYCALAIIAITTLISFHYRYGRNLPKTESHLIYASHLTSEVELDENEEQKEEDN